MQLIRGQHNLPAPFDHCVASIGAFDGLHLGHQQLIKELVGLAKKTQLPSLVITFEPQPKEYFSKTSAQARLMRLSEKAVGLKALGVDYLFCIYFNRDFSLMSAEDFVEKILVQALGIKALLVGDDFRFGAGRRGDFALLQSLAKQYQFTALQFSTFYWHEQRVSSSLVRQALQQGDLVLVEQLLARPYYLCGKVAYGDQRGRTLGFPTANIHLHRALVPLTGVFVVRVKGIAGAPFYGVANVGVRPTFDGTRTLLEVHLFDFDQTIYGANIQVEFLHKVRDEKKFEVFDELVKRIKQDVIEAKLYLSSKSRHPTT